MLRWFGHVIGGDFNIVRLAMEINIDGKRGKGRQKRD